MIKIKNGKHSHTCPTVAEAKEFIEVLFLARKAIEDADRVLRRQNKGNTLASVDEALHALRSIMS